MTNSSKVVYVVGSGFYGSVLAERIANNTNLKVIIIEKRDHIGGNSHSYKDTETNIEVHKYGSHLFHTSDEEVWLYLQKFTKFNNYQHHVYTCWNEKIYSMPINLDTINSFYNHCFSPNEARDFIKQEIARSKITEPMNLEEKAISLIGEGLYNAFIRGYTAKQWEANPKKLPAHIITRLPVRYNYNRRYFKDKYEGLPVDGYGKVFEKMLSHEQIEIQLNTDFFDIQKFLEKDALIFYSGPIDRYFNYCHGELGWRTIDFEVEKLLVDDYQGTSVMNYASEKVPYTRIHEFKHYHPERLQSKDKTIIFKEYSRTAKRGDAPYYPINTDKDKERYRKYLELARKEKNVVFGGRLGTYTYLDMHQVIRSALTTYKKFF